MRNLHHIPSEFSQAKNFSKVDFDSSVPIHQRNFYSDFLKGPESAVYLRISKATFHKLNKRAGFPEPRYVGASPVWRRDDLEAWVNAQTSPINA